MLKVICTNFRTYRKPYFAPYCREKKTNLHNLLMPDPWPVNNGKREGDGNNAAPESDKVKLPKMRPRLHVILMAYCGKGYLGLQRNAGCKTIEEDLCVALRKIDVLNEEEFKTQQLVHFQRAARTDKGVSALRQIINLKMRENCTPEEINEHLPEQIRVLCVRRVTKGFNCKNTCDARTYSYTCPTFVFAPKDVTPTEDYRITPERLAELAEWSKSFVGTHNYHAFTSGRKSRDPSCNRHIIKVETKPPFVTEGIELIIFIVKGQSFMLHQIRKMMAALISIARGFVQPDYITKSFDPDTNNHISIAPGNGLLLEQVHYDWYNKKYAGNGIHESLEFEECEAKVEEFRKRYINPQIIAEEKEEKSMMKYLDELTEHFETIEQVHGSDEEGEEMGEKNAADEDEIIDNCVKEEGDLAEEETTAAK